MRYERHDWAAVASEAMWQSPNWVLAFRDHPQWLMYLVRTGRVKAMRRDDGHFESFIVNRYKPPGEPARGDIWVRWVPNERN